MTPQDILHDPHWFPVQFDLNADTVTFLKTDREQLSAGSFLDQRFYRADDTFQAVRLSDAFKLVSGGGETDLKWIFHSAFCCSTLISRALDAPGKVLALKEPDILMQLANTKRMADRNGHSQQQVAAIEALVLSLLSRRFSDQEQVLIKLTNPANFLMPRIMSSGTNAVVMTSSLEEFLISVIRKGEECMSFVRILFNIFHLDGTGLSKISERDALKLTDLQIAALVWQHQHEDLTGVSQMHPSKVRAVHGLQFPDNREQVMRAARDFLGLNLSNEDIATNANGPLFARHSKYEGESFDAGVRLDEIEQIKNDNADRLSRVMDWQSKIDLGRPYRYLPAPSLVD
jgi:hypothetical protein